MEKAPYWCIFLSNLPFGGTQVRFATEKMAVEIIPKMDLTQLQYYL